MILCIPTNGDKSANDSVSEHFGSAAYFTIYDTSDDSMEVIGNENQHHSHGTCHPFMQLGKYKIDGLICSGIGRRAIEQLKENNVKVYQTPEKTVAKVVEKIKEGQLEEIDPATACHGQAGMNEHRDEGQQVNRHQHRNKCNR